MNYIKSFALAALALVLTGCVSSQTYTADSNDPYQGYNRAMFKFNNGFYDYVATPVNDVYTNVTPSFARDGVRNFFRNIALVPGLANDALQWNWGYFGKDAVRLLLNSTLGLFGLFDVAGNSGISWHPQGFGYTLAKWGGPNSISQPGFLELPFLGPSTVSDTIGFVVDIYSSPVTYVSPSWAQNIMIATYTLQKNADTLPTYYDVTKTALDPYIALREAYLQNRAYNIQQIRYDGHVPENVLTQQGITPEQQAAAN